MKRVRTMLCALLGLALALNALLPGYAHAVTSPDMSGWKTEDGATYRDFSNAAGVSRVEFSDWNRIGENNLQFSTNLTLENAGLLYDDNIFELTTVDGADPSQGTAYQCLVIKPSVSEADLKAATVMLHWPRGAYLQDGTPVPVTVAVGSFALAVGNPSKLTAPLRVIRTLPAQTIQLESFYNGTGGVATGKGTGVRCVVNVALGVPQGLSAAQKSMIFTATDLDIADAGDYMGPFAESVTFGAGVLGAVYVQDRTYADFPAQPTTTEPLYGSAATGRFINVEELVASNGTHFSATRKTDGADQERAAGLATLVDSEHFSFTWTGNNCGTALFMQAGLSPELTVRNVGSFPDKITTTDDQFADADPYQMPVNLYVNPTTPERLSHTYRVHWKSQKSVTAQADPGYLLSKVHLERDVAGETTRRSVDVAQLQVGVETPFSEGLSASTITLHEDGTVTVRIADEDPTGPAGTTGFMNDYTVEFEAVDNVLDIVVQKEWVGEPAHEAHVELYRNDMLVDTAIITAEDGWRHVFASMPELDEQGDPYRYSVVELPVPGYESKVQGDAHAGFRVTNYATAETVDIVGTKVWDDQDDAAGIRPDSITLRLYAGGEEVARTTTSAADGWAWAFTGLPKYDRGTLVEYQVSEDAVEGYATSYDPQAHVITNTHVPETTSIAVRKAWLYGDLTPMEDTSGLAPVTIELHRIVDAAAGITEPVEGQVLTLSHEQGWSGYFTGVPVLVDGEPAQYTVFEVQPEGYTSDVMGDMYQGFTVTNRQNATEVGFQKLAADTGQPLAGAWLTLRDQGGTILATWETDGSAYVRALVPGTYTLEERRAPEGYLVADTVEFTVGYDGSVSVAGVAVGTVTMTDQPIPPLVPEGDPDDPEDDPEDDPADVPDDGGAGDDDPSDGTDAPSTDTSTTTTTTTSPTTTATSKALPVTADASLPVLFYAIGALASIGFALVLRRRY